MSDKYPREGEETGATAESTTPYVSRRNVEGGQDPKPPTQPGQPDPEKDAEEERKRQQEEEERRRKAS